MVELLQGIESEKQDAVMYKARYVIEKAGSDPDKYANAVRIIGFMLTNIGNVVKREKYAELISKQCKIKSSLLKKQLTACTEENERDESQRTNVPDDVQWSLPRGVNVEEAYRNGFYALEKGAEHTGYYFPSGLKEWQQQSNFVIKPMLHVVSKQDNKRILEIYNGISRQLVDIDSRLMLSVDHFAGSIYQLPGNNIFFGTKQHLMKLLKVYGEHFEVCYELKTLGWQEEGFFAYHNGIVIGKEFISMDERGTVDADGRKYYSPSASSIYANARKDDDEYANDRYLHYGEPLITFEQWCKRIVAVYTESNSGMFGIAFMLIGLFQDIIRSIDKNCPLLSAYGEKGSGKSKFAESISNAFFNELPPCNLFHSTDFAFANRLSRYSNCVVWFDEFNDTTIREERFEAVKASYDGIARERGRGGNKNKTEILSVKSALLLTGQYLSTKDDNAALTRCIIVPFKKRADDTAFKQEEIKQYEELKALESKGLSGMLPEVLQYRTAFRKTYPMLFAETFSEMREKITSVGTSFNERVLRNYCAMATCIKFFSDKFSFPFSTEYFNTTVHSEVIRLSALISESDSLADFWNTIVYLMETGEIEEGFHFKVETHVNVNIDGQERKFPQPVKILFLRLTTIHKLYMESFRRQNGKNGVNLKTIELYLTTARGYLGRSKSSSYVSKHGDRQITSGFLFNYDVLGVPLEMEKSDTTERVLSTLTGVLFGQYRIQHVSGKPTLCYEIVVDHSYMLLDKQVEDKRIYKCYDVNLDNEAKLSTMYSLQITGELKENKWTDGAGIEKVKRIVQVTEINKIISETGIRENEMPF